LEEEFAGYNREIEEERKKAFKEDAFILRDE
jgi:hypothetical protein